MTVAPRRKAAPSKTIRQAEGCNKLFGFCQNLLAVAARHKRAATPPNVLTGAPAEQCYAQIPATETSDALWMSAYM